MSFYSKLLDYFTIYSPIQNFLDTELMKDNLSREQLEILGFLEDKLDDLDNLYYVNILCMFGLYFTVIMSMVSFSTYLSQFFSNLILIFGWAGIAPFFIGYQIVLLRKQVHINQSNILISKYYSLKPLKNKKH